MDEDEGHTNNDKLRMMGQEGDDEDGLEDDWLALFGPRRDNVEVIMPVPPPCAAGGVGVAAGAGAGAGAAAGAAPDNVSHAGEK